MGRALPADRPEGRGPHLRGGHPGQLPVRQGRRRVRDEDRAPARPAAPRCRSSSPRWSRRTPTPRAARSAPTEIWDIFSTEYLTPGQVALEDHQSSSVVDGKHVLYAEISVDGATQEIEGVGNGPISAFCSALASVGVDVRVLDYAEHALTEGTDAQAAAYVEVAVAGPASPGGRPPGNPPGRDDPCNPPAEPRWRRRGLLGRRHRHEHRDRVHARGPVRRQPFPPRLVPVLPLSGTGGGASHSPTARPGSVTPAEPPGAVAPYPALPQCQELKAAPDGGINRPYRSPLAAREHLDPAGLFGQAVRVKSRRARWLDRVRSRGWPVQ